METTHTAAGAHTEPAAPSRPTRADRLIAEAEAASARLTDPRDRLAHQVGYLHGTVRTLCAELQRYEPPRMPADQYDVEIDGVPYQVGIACEPDDWGVLCVVDLHVCIRGVDVGHVLPIGLRDEIEAEALRQHKDAIRDAADEHAIEAWQDREAA